MNWLPAGKTAAVCFSVDDVHPSTSDDAYEAGGDLNEGALGFVERLLEAHQHLKATLFVTPDWRPVQLVRSRSLARLPILSNFVYHVDRHSDGRFRVDRHPRFIQYLNDLARVEVAPHGLHHLHPGRTLAVEFQKQTRAQCVEMLRHGAEIFARAGLEHANGFAPPGWNLPEPLIAALEDRGFVFVSSARDVRTPIATDARARMSGLQGVKLIAPQVVGSRLVHIPVNFQATSSFDRAREVLENRGLLSIKAHVFKHGGGYTMLDGLDERYCDCLDRLFGSLKREFGDALWWPSMSDIANQYLASLELPLSPDPAARWLPQQEVRACGLRS